MPCPHNEITIVQRSQQQSAVAAAAYQSGEKLFCEYDQEVKHYPEKRGIVHNEILLPANAPRSYADRNTLWNAAETVEKQWNSQLARRWVLTIPREIPPDQYAVLVREFCQQQFVSKGMIADFAIHDPHPPGHNPHAHVLLTMRAMDEHGKWLPKSRKVYDLDENGERIKLPSGRWKSHKEDTVDWNDQKYCEIWRHEWEVIQNRYLEANDRPERVDLRSYARQGLDIIPTVHEGAAVRQMEKRGIQTNIGNLNREIRAANSLMKSIRQLIQNLKGWITELGEKRKELLAQKAAEEATLLPNLLMRYMEIRKEERKDWTRAGQNRGTSQDLKAVSEALSYLRQKGLSTVEDLEAFLESSGKSATDYRNQMKPKETRSKVIDGILASRTDCKECTTPPAPTLPSWKKTCLRKSRCFSKKEKNNSPKPRHKISTLFRAAFDVPNAALSIAGKFAAEVSNGSVPGTKKTSRLVTRTTTAKNEGEAPMWLVENSHPAIVTREIFNKAQEESARRKAKAPVSQKSAMTASGKYSKYALTEVMICGECGSRYKRVTWNIRGKRRIVWRCISRLDYGKKYCTESITVDEQALQRAIVRALNRFNVEDEATYLLLMKSTIGEAVGINGSSDEIDLLERRIDALNKRMLDLVSLSVQEGDDAENHEDDFKNISTQIEQLTKRITAIRESESENGDFQARLKEIQDIIDKRRENKDIYDDSIVRQMVECIKVYHDGRLQIILGGGYELEEYLEK